MTTERSIDTDVISLELNSTLEPNRKFKVVVGPLPEQGYFGISLQSPAGVLYIGELDQTVLVNDVNNGRMTREQLRIFARGLLRMAE